MASDDEAGPSNKYIKLDATEPIMDVRAMNKLFSKIDNLEHFPLKVLMNIFTRLDYVDLYNLAEESSRFERIAKIVLNERYSHEYFIVDEYKQTQKTYIDFFERFGSVIKSLNVQKVKEVSPCEDFWITSLLDKAKSLGKLSFEGIPSFLYNNDGILSHVNENITHLMCRNCDALDYSELPKFHNLKKLELFFLNGAVIDYDVVAKTIRNNPALESLVLSDKRQCKPYRFGPLMQLIGTHLKQLKQLEYTPRSQYISLAADNRTPRNLNQVIEEFVGSLKNLESFGLSANVRRYTHFNELLRRLSSECKSIKHLKLYDIDGDDIELFGIIRSFEKIESLALAFIKFGDEIKSLVEHLPFLRELDITMHTRNVNWSFVLVMLRKCTTLEKLTITGDPVDDEMEMFGTSKFHNDFIESIQNPNVKLEVKFRGQRVGFISKNEVIWRNKLVHWKGYDPDVNSSDKIFLDLAKETSSAVNAEQPSPFDLILGYLDLKSLCSLSQMSKKCLELVENHVKQRSQQQETFTITNELRSDYDGLEMFAEYVFNLKINIFNLQFGGLQELLVGFHNLTKLHVYTEVDISLHRLSVPQVRHLILDGPGFKGYFELHALSVICPDLETLELKKPIYGWFDEEKKERLEFRNLMKFTLKTHKDYGYQYQEYAVKNLQTIFNDTNTKLHFV